MTETQVNASSDRQNHRVSRGRKTRNNLRNENTSRYDYVNVETDLFILLREIRNCLYKEKKKKKQ